MEVLTQYPSWFIILCVAAGIIFASSLYLRDKLTQDLHGVLKMLLGVMRFVAVALLAFFLLEPLIKKSTVETEKPILVLAQDNSESLVIGEDSTYYKSEFQEKVKQTYDALSLDYEVVPLTFGNEVNESLSLDFSEKQTNFSQLFDELKARYSNRNLGAVVIASDGIYNQGKNPLYSNAKLNCPIYTIALGDTAQYKDGAIQEVNHNKLAYLGNKFPLEVVVNATALKGSSPTLKVSKNGSTVFQSSLSINQDEFTEVLPIILEANRPGIQKYSISLSQTQGEITYTNNYRDIYIDVLDSRQKVAIIAAAPHPDIKAIRRSISSNENYEVSTFLASEFNGNLKDYNLIVFHQLPSSLSSDELAEKAIAQQIPALFIWGEKTDFTAFKNLGLGLSLNKSGANSNAIDGANNAGFKSYLTDPEFNALLRKFPPTNVPFGKIDASPGLNTLLFQKVGPIETDDPLFTFTTKNDTKLGVFTGEGIWRWRLFTHLENGNHETFDKWFLKSVQFLANKEDKSLFRVNSKGRFNETDRIVFTAELYTENYEPLPGQEITILLADEDGNEYPFTFSQNGETYRLDAGLLPPGNYTYAAATSATGKNLTKRGEITISEVLTEQVNTTANHNLLYNLAVRNSGKMLFPNQMNELTSLISANSEIVPVSYEKKSLTDLINYKWLLFLIIGLLCLEWLTRKRSGVY